MAETDSGVRPWWRQRSRRQRRAIVGIGLVAVVLLVPALREMVAAVVAALVVLALLVVVVGVVCLVAGVRLVERHPVADLVVGVLVARHRSRARRRAGDRGGRGPQAAPGDWPPGSPWQPDAGRSPGGGAPGGGAPGARHLVLVEGDGPGPGR